MDLIKLRMLAGIQLTPDHYRELKALHEEKAKKDYDKDGKLETPKKEYKGSRDKAIKKNVREQEMTFQVGGNENRYKNEPGDFSTSDNIDPNDPEVLALIAKLRHLSDEEMRAVINDLIAKSREVVGNAPPEEDIQSAPLEMREDHFKKGQAVKDKKGYDWKVVSYSGEGDDEIYTLKCPKTGKVVKKKYTELHEGTSNYGDNHPHALTHDNLTGAVNVAGSAENTLTATIQSKDESPDVYAHVDQGPHTGNDTERKITVPQSVKTALNNTINEIRRVAEKLEKRDPAQSWFDNMAANAMQEILNNLNQGTVAGIKEAQILTTSLMSPIVQRIPSEVFLFIARGGQPRSLKDYFQEVKK